MDSHVNASVTQADGVHDETGKYATLIYAGCETKERADEIEDGLHRAGRRLGFSIHTKIKKRGDVWDVEYVAINKTFGRKYILEKHGPDRSKWPYDPRRKGR